MTMPVFGRVGDFRRSHSKHQIPDAQARAGVLSPADVLLTLLGVLCFAQFCASLLVP